MAHLQDTTRMARNREGFTLIELLIAVLIISILATLVTLGVSKAMSYAKQVANKTEMGQIEQALGVAAIEMGRVPFIPSFILLKNDRSNYDPNKSLDSFSLRILTQMFPNAWPPIPNTIPQKHLKETWAGSTGEKLLGPDQAFVFFLRGASGNGFQAKGQPSLTGSGGKTYGPYFNFAPNRLIDFYEDGFPVYLDCWENDPKKSNKPFLYVFSQMMVGQPESPYKEKFDEYNALKLPVYRQLDVTGKKYWMPKGYQIFSAGKDGLWGSYLRGSQFSGSLSAPGEDDQSNFADEPHGKPIND